MKPILCLALLYLFGIFQLIWILIYLILFFFFFFFFLMEVNPIRVIKKNAGYSLSF